MRTLELLKSLIAIRPEDDACILWLRDSKSRYPRVTVNGKVRQASHTAYELAFGAIPPSNEICHKCDNPQCIRPSHLFPGTRLANMEDCATKGRNAQGERHGMSRLSVEQVREIRRLRATGWTQRALADQFKVSFQLISKIVLGKNWQCVTVGTDASREQRRQINSRAAIVRWVKRKAKVA